MIRVLARQFRRAAALGAALCTIATLATTPGTGAGAVPDSTGPSPPATPLATSFEDASGGAWATIALGRLGQPLDTFWQLFYRPSGASRWSDVVSGMAVATNGGVVLATPDGRTLLVGVRPSNLLTFSPVLSTANGGRTWSPGAVLTEGLAARPDALAADAAGDQLALVSGHGGAAVLARARTDAGWHQLSSEKALTASGAGHTCGLGAITAIAERAGQAILGAECTRPGAVGILMARGGSWQLVGPSLPAALRGSVEVLNLRVATGGLSALLAVSAPSGTRLVAATMPAGTNAWTLSAGLVLGVGARVVSFGPSTGTGVFALVADHTGTERIAVTNGGASTWKLLPTPPQGTATVVFGAGGNVDALAVNGTVMTDWTRRTGAAHWTSSQRIEVPIEFGSSA